MVKPILHCRFKVITSPKVDGIVGWGGGVLLPVVSFGSLISLSHPRVLIEFSYGNERELDLSSNSSKCAY